MVLEIWNLLKIIPRVSTLWSKMFSEIIFPKLGSKWYPFLTKGQKVKNGAPEPSTPSLCQKYRPFRSKFLKKNFCKHLWSLRGFSRDYFKPDFRSLGPLVSIFKGLRMTACWVQERLFWPFVKKGDHLDPKFGKIISGNIFDHEEDTLGIILSPISGL